MKAVPFLGSNGMLSGGPADQYGTAENVADLYVHRDGQVVTSCWRPSWWERFQILLGCRVYLRVLAKTSHAPVSIEVMDESQFLVEASQVPSIGDE